MVIQSGNSSNWSQLLKSADMFINSTRKKSHGNTPFRVMWGRNSRYEDLIPAINNNITVSQAAIDEIDSVENIISDDDIVEGEDLLIISPSREQLQEQIQQMDEFRTATFELAGENIRTEQLKQKRQYDKKVSQNRYLD